ncbi:unnamed protein product [Dimorphilus gyrociliatus]|uniref:Innexin n=1 Tax=Dimorphilus gyrociliatus TaxID=2664684 RepID=A0A7I8VSM5_9ANNE|nr:unnamed protein product [Dimorphilus gyrociliatus]
MVARRFHFSVFNFSKDDGIVDKLSRKYTVIIFILASLFVVYIQVSGKGIQCLFPSQFTNSHEQHGQAACLYTDSYYFRSDSAIPTKHGNKKTINNYFKWFSLILLLQAFVSYSPSIVWKCFYRVYGTNLDQIVNSAENLAYTEENDTRKKKLQIISSKVLQKNSSLLPTVYGFVRKMYLLNGIGQMVLFGMMFNWGIFKHRYQKIANDYNLTMNEYFPRSIMCDYSVRTLNRIHSYTLECRLAINEWNFIIFHILWVWLLFVSVITFLASVQQFFRYITNNDRFLRENLKSKLRGSLDIRDFKRYLCRDGEFILKIISENSEDVVTSEIICYIWDNYTSIIHDGKEGRNIELLQGQ